MATLSPISPFRAFDNNGDPLTGGKLYTYEAGTTTPKSTYTDSSESIAHSNPVILNSTGYAGSDATPLGVWLGDGGYKFVLKTSADATLWTIDNVGGDVSTAFGGQSYDNNTNLNITSVYANAVINQTAGGTLSLLPVATAGEGFYFIVKKNTTSTVTIDPNASETINGATTLALTSDAIIYCDGTKWLTIMMSPSTSGNNAFTGNNTFSGTSSFSNDVTFTGDVRTPNDGTITIASGVVTVTGAYHFIDTEGAASTDDLVTINGGVDGQILTLNTVNSGRDVVLKTTGNITLPGDVTLSADNDPIKLIYNNTLAKWVQTGATASQGKKADTALQPGQASLVTSGTPVTVSGTSVDITSLPSGIKTIIMSFAGVSTNGTNNLSIQIGGSGGIENTGYLGATIQTNGAGNNRSNFSSGFFIKGSNSANSLHGVVTLSLLDSTTNTWSASGVLGTSAGSPNTDMQITMGGSKSLSDVLDRIRLTTEGGVDTFDAGKVNINYTV